MNTKTYKAICLFNEGNFKESFAILKTFRIGYSKDEKRTLEIASDILHGSSKFYKQLGVDTEKVLANAKHIVTEKYEL